MSASGRILLAVLPRWQYICITAHEGNSFMARTKNEVLTIRTTTGRLQMKHCIECTQCQFELPADPRDVELVIHHRLLLACSNCGGVPVVRDNGLVLFAVKARLSA